MAPSQRVVCQFFFLGWPKKKCSKRCKMQFDQGNNIIHTFWKIKKNPSFSIVNILTQKKYMRMLWCLTPTLSIISFVWPNQVERKHDGDWKDFLAICASLPAPQQIKDWTGKSKRGKNILTLNRSFSPELGGPLLCWVCSTTLLLT